MEAQKFAAVRDQVGCIRVTPNGAGSVPPVDVTATLRVFLFTPRVQ